jgi:hypothetical protein
VLEVDSNEPSYQNNGKEAKYAICKHNVWKRTDTRNWAIEDFVEDEDNRSNNMVDFEKGVMNVDNLEIGRPEPYQSAISDCGYHSNFES